MAWAWLCWAVTIEPFEVSLRRGGCGGLLWDFNHAGSLVQSRRGRLRRVPPHLGAAGTGSAVFGVARRAVAGGEAGVEDVLRRGVREHA
jgi:hypothetical protein